MAEEMNVFSVGDLVKGTVTKVEDKQVFVDVGFKVDGIVPISELAALHIGKAGDVVAVNDELELQVTKVEDDELVLSKKAVQAEKAWQQLEDLQQKDEQIEAAVAEVVKGGLVVDVGVRGFVPASHVERHYVEDFSTYIGQKLQLKIIELDKEHNKLILSQRAVQEGEVERKKKDTLQSIEVGSTVKGTVQRLATFGAFVDIGGVDGLVHISQLAHERVESPQDVLSEGETVTVKVLSVDLDNERISLSIKDTLPGPWANVSTTLNVNDIVSGTVKRLANFGAFVEVLPGVEGLVHISQISTRHIGNPSEVLEVGQTVDVKILEINEADKRISLSIREAQEEEVRNETRAYEKQHQEESSGFSLADMIGDQLKKYRP
ncbi:30S ribosomal protein S1 [Shouchella miscanthi]|uniref:30S ribosomal protein S1 n=1 Tax=Shouchella miscanthi TaxID=2598861 RepID=UPI0011A2A46D|nr:30S ribosomal protein S1 [Shouchella miscanthi]